MELIAGTLDFKLNTPTAVAIGKFDGVHIGHVRLLEEIIKKKSEGLKACVFTFDPSPAELFGYDDGCFINSREEKRLLLENLGIDILVEFPLDLKTAAMLPEAFIEEMLCDKLNAQFIAAGEDLSFGYKGAGDAKLLQMLAPQYGMNVKIISKVCVENNEVSSSLIRELIVAGKLEKAMKLMGRGLIYSGEVVKGRHLGHSLGFPTVNLLVDDRKVVPPFGVYTSTVLLNGKMYRGLSNIGRKPTIDKNLKVGLETYIYNFDEDIYGENIVVELMEFCRPEMNFESLEGLEAQLQHDIECYRP